jgi:hypothetical protein
MNLHPYDTIHHDTTCHNKPYEVQNVFLIQLLNNFFFQI